MLHPDRAAAFRKRLILPCVGKPSLFHVCHFNAADDIREGGDDETWP